MYAQESTTMLAKAGIDFSMHQRDGIDPFEFGALLISSGLVLLDDVHWVSFHSGYDFGYLMKHAGRNQAVNGGSPLTPAASQILINLGQKSGLQDIADELGVKRLGIAHQAGSDSLVTGELFWKMRQVIFNGSIDEARYSGQIWGLNGQMPLVMYQTPPNLNGATIYSPNVPPQHMMGGAFGAFQMARS